MKRLFLTFFFCCVLIISAFLLFGGVEIWIEANLTSTSSFLTFTTLSFFFLTFDVVLPVPSSLLMVMNGKVLGLFLGSLTSLAAGMVSSCIGFCLGRKAGLLLDRLFTRKEFEMSNHLFQKFGTSAIAISKALPILSEAVSVVSGTTSTSFSTFFLYSLAGHAAVSCVYGYVGSYTSDLDSSAVTGVVIVFALFITWILQLLVKKSRPVARNV